MTTTQMLEHGQQRVPMLPRALEILQYRELLFTLAVRELKLRYRNSVLGFVWSLLNPLLMMAVFLLVFGVMMPNNGVKNFPAFLLAGILPWNWLAATIGGSVNCLVGNANLLKKVYFPAEVLPISAALANMINFLLAMVAFFAIFFAFGLTPTVTVVLLPVVMIVQLIFLLGASFFLSALNVSFRDTAVIMEVVIMAWFFFTPVFYDIHQLFPEYGRLMYIVNPAASLVSSYRLILLDGAWPEPLFLLRTFGTSLLVFVVGYAFFLRRVRRFGDEL
ncbi:MAG: ABC transporter permease [Chloroflexota bacterium]|nr:MAG: ABC transporter permease [Chloroflexota bacterium]